jgi:hypothetical protein
LRFRIKKRRAINEDTLEDTMKKIINGLRYGNTKTKTYIIGVLLLILFGTFSIGAIIVTKLPLWGMSVAFCYLLAIILMQSVSFHKVGEVIEKEKKSKTNEKKAKKESTTKEKVVDKDAADDEESDEDPDEVLQQYDEKKIKGVFVKYKVNKDHFPIMVDSCATYKIYQCPAYAWLEKGTLNLLLFEKEPRKVEISITGTQEITYERGVAVNTNMDYKTFSKPSFINLIFSAYLPSIYEETIAGRRSYRKNLYVIGTDLKVTNTSAATIMKLLSLNLSVRKQIRDTTYQNPYFEAAYALNVMLKDNVISVNEFKIKIKDILQKLADAKISNQEFMEYMNQLIQGRLITREYAQYYIERR